MSRRPSPSGDGTSSAAKVTPLRPRRPCPECRKASSREFYPFCSARCKDVDLNRWLSGAYAIPLPESGNASDDET